MKPTPSHHSLPDKADLLSWVREFKGKRVAVIGDVMLDVYLKGGVARISPEAPIPVVELNEKDRSVPGGAANVACNIAALGGRAVLVGVIGRDPAGRTLVQSLRMRGVDVSGLVALADRPTTEKVRVIANTQQVVRIDREVKSPISKAAAAQVLSRAFKAIAGCDAVVFEDYNKGLLTPEVIRKAMAFARGKKKITTVDPKFQNFFEYQGATVVKPNLKEAKEALGTEAAGKTDVGFIGGKLLKRLKCQSVVVTLGEAGVALLERNMPLRTIPTFAREVYDVSGAGDTVIATLTLALAAGADLLSASALANYAASLEVAKLGVATVSATELSDRLREED